MNKNLLFEKISKAAIACAAMQPSTHVYATIVKEALEITQADHAILFTSYSDTLQKAFSSSAMLKSIKIGSIKKTLNKKQIILEDKNALEKLQPDLSKNGISSAALVPLQSENQQLGILALYATNNDFFTQERVEIVEIFQSIATLALAKDKLQETSKKALETRDHFISLASHELRTPLTSINGYIELLYTRVSHDNSLEARWIQALHTESVRMTNLVKELLDVNRIKQGQFDFVFGDVSLKEVIAKAIGRHALTNEDHPVIFENNLQEEQSHIIGDFDKLIEMMSGLLGNAVKFSKPDAKIIVSLTHTNNALSITVKSLGREMTKQDVAAIFEGFYKSRHPGIEGMGVGLLIAKHIIENHRGKIDISSKKNDGTTVKVTLPGKKI